MTHHRRSEPPGGRRPGPAAAGPWLLAVALALSACTTTKAPQRPAEDRGAPTPAAAPSTDRPPTLASERQWLQSWFQGTPVKVAPSGAQAFIVEVPGEHSFDVGQTQVKPALAAVLDKLAQSLRRLPQARLPLAAAPGDTSGSSPLALRRADQIRVHLVQRGVSPVRMGPATAAGGASVQLRVELGRPD